MHEAQTLVAPRAAGSRAARAPSDLLRVLTLNTHRGRGPGRRHRPRRGHPDERLRIVHEFRAYTFHIAQWLQRHADLHDVVGLQEVWLGLLGGIERLWRRRTPQAECYRAVGEFRHAFVHRIGHPAFRYDNVLLSRLPHAEDGPVHLPLPGRVFQVAVCGATFAPVRWADRTVWIGNTHLHAYNARKRGRQVEAIARFLARLGDVPVLLLGDLNTVPHGTTIGEPKPYRGPEARCYRNDRTLHVLQGAGLRAVPHADVPETWTFPVGNADRTLDYVLFSRHWEVEGYRVRDDFTFSDHFPVEAALRLRSIPSGTRVA
jgi:endonuclease/exonuclease/phosphatase family metal-dependent hydrolase